MSMPHRTGCDSQEKNEMQNNAKFYTVPLMTRSGFTKASITMSQSSELQKIANHSKRWL